MAFYTFKFTLVGHCIWTLSMWVFTRVAAFLLTQGKKGRIKIQRTRNIRIEAKGSKTLTEGKRKKLKERKENNWRKKMKILEKKFKWKIRKMAEWKIKGMMQYRFGNKKLKIRNSIMTF